MKANLDFTTTLPHHSDEEATMDVTITNWQEGPELSVSVEKQRVSLNRAEIEQLLHLITCYEQARAILEKNDVPIRKSL